MTNDNDIIDNPKGYGIQDPQHPGEPNYWAHDVSQPVPGTAKQTRNENEGRPTEKKGEGSGSRSGGGRDSH